MNFPPDTVDTTSLETRAMASSDGSVCYRYPSVNMIWKTTPVAMENEGYISKEEIDEMRKQTVLIDVTPIKMDANSHSGCKPTKPPLPLGLPREEYTEIKLQWKNFCKKLLLILQDRSGSVMIVVEFGAFARDFIPLPNDERKFKRLQCCHPHLILIQFAKEEDVRKFILAIARSYTMTNDICEEDVSALCRYFKFGTRSALPQCMPIESAEYQGWYAKLMASLPQCMDNDSAEYQDWYAKLPQSMDKESAEFKSWIAKVRQCHSAWGIYNGKVKGILTAAQFRYIEGSLKGLGLCHESVQSAWAINKGDAHGPLTAAQVRYIEGCLKGLKGMANARKRRAEVAQLIRDGLEGEVTTEEMEENKNSVASGKKGMQTHNYNSWAIKSVEENKMLKHGSQEACELTKLSTNDIAKFLKASRVDIEYS